MVDPSYFYPDQDILPQTFGASQPPNSGARKEDYDMARTTSRTRRPSGKIAMDNDERAFVPPAAPDAPRSLPPVSYRDPYVSDAVPPFVNDTSKSFAARARASPANLDLAPAIEDTRPTRRTSVSRPSGTIYPQVKPPVQTQLASDPRQPTSPDLSSSATTPRQDRITDAIFAHQSKSRTDPRRPANVKAPLAGTHTRRLSTTASEQRTAWAEDRSPLQTLEVKLNDISKISKEEKRARVEQAEQLLRESKAANGYRRISQEPTSVENRTSSRRVSTAGVNDRSNEEFSRRASRAEEKLRPQPAGERPRQVAVERPTVENSDTSLSRRQKDASELSQRQIRAGDIPSTEPVRPTSQNRASQDPQRPARVISSNKTETRGVRFQTQDYTDESYSDQWGSAGPNTRRSDNTRDRTKLGDHEIEAAALRRGDVGSIQRERKHMENSTVENSSNVPKEQLDLYASRLEPSLPSDSAALYGGAPDPLPINAVRGHGPALKYELPPQMASSIEARQFAGFGSGQKVAFETSADGNHHLTDNFRHGHKNASASNAEHQTQPKEFEEWRQGRVARLTASDFTKDQEAPNSKATWWEEDRSGYQRRANRSGQGSVEKSQASGGGYEDDHGTVHFSSVDFDKDSADSVSMERRGASGTVRARQYISDEGTSRVQRRTLSWLRAHASLAELCSTKDRKLALSSSYSYSCPQLAKHDLHHLHHICYPYMDKELTRSMRSIRIRTAAIPSSFNPRLYLKCGPLLRYTGTKKARVQTPRSRGGNSISERETWRGSVMIVTVDADSSYEPAPILRLFPQSMTLLPPPPQQVDGESGEGLPSEYVDPVAGLPKLSRTGNTVYVKPVEDLEEGVDLSLLENDDGLFEVTRTAAVPTSYGKGENPPPLGRSTLRGKTGANGSRGQEVRGVRLHAERGVTFWRFNLEVELGEQQARIAYSINQTASVGFWVPAKGQTMNIMFHSCNGFSLSVK